MQLGSARPPKKRNELQLDYVITWFEEERREAVYESAQQAIEFAKELIDAGRRRVEVTMPRTNSVIRGQAILDIYDAIAKPT